MRANAICVAEVIHVIFNRQEEVNTIMHQIAITAWLDAVSLQNRTK